MEISDCMKSKKKFSLKWWPDKTYLFKSVIPMEHPQ